MKLIVLISIFISSFAFAQQKMVCVSWMDYKVEIIETPVTEYATATINHDQGDWAFTADYFEGRFNYLTIYYKPLKINSTSRATVYPLESLSIAFEVDGKQASVDCDIRPL